MKCNVKDMTGVKLVNVCLCYLATNDINFRLLFIDSLDPLFLFYDDDDDNFG